MPATDGAMVQRAVSELRKFVAPEFVLGVGARRLTGRYVQNLGARKVLVVTDPGVQAAGWVSEVTAALQVVGCSYVVFDGVTPNPKDHEVMAGAEVYRQEQCDLIVAVGGGSPIDAAKGIGIVVANHQPILALAGVERVPQPGPPLICIPTTAGTGADVSQFAIILDTQQRVKMAILSKTLVPDAALVDAETTLTMDPALTAATGLDVLTHAIEAFVSTASSPITDLHALEAMRLVAAYLPIAVAEPHNLAARRQMMLASLHAGLAFSNASLGAVHALAHSLGGYLDQPHGECNALLLPYVIELNFDAAVERYLRIGQALGLALAGLPIARQKQALVKAVKRLVETLGVKTSLRELGVQREDLPALAERAWHDPCLATNPRRLTLAHLKGIYEAAF